jgi:hypothetical protein
VVKHCLCLCTCRNEMQSLCVWLFVCQEYAFSRRVAVVGHGLVGLTVTDVLQT